MDEEKFYVVSREAATKWFRSQRASILGQIWDRSHDEEEFVNWFMKAAKEIENIHAEADE